LILCDTSGLLALFDAGERDHRRVRKAIEREPGPLLTTDFVLAELDFLLVKRLGRAAEKAFLAQLDEGVLTREPITDDDLSAAAKILDRFGDHEFGLTDATLMAAAERLELCPILTLDRRHFGLFRDRLGRALPLLP
jgi:uncharacterized protein